MAGVSTALGARESPEKNRAGLPARTAAGVIDVTLFFGLSICIAKMALSLWWILPLLLLLLEIGYRLHGSVGKWLFGLRVEVLNRKRFYIREILGKLASCATFGIGFLLILVSDHRALHDYIAGTQVVTDSNRSRTSLAVRIAAMVLTVAIVALSVGILIGRNSQRRPVVVSTADRRDLSRITRQFPAVLTIHGYRNSRLVVQGSGFLISADGQAVTNFHILRQVTSAEVTLGDGRIYQVVSILAFDKQKDLVIFQVARGTAANLELPNDLPFLVLGSSAKVQVGDPVITVGSPEGLGNTISDGLLSGIRSGTERLLQISAPISPGSSGGPVFDLHGNVIAVAKSQFQEGQNLNFAIPIEAVANLP